MINKVKNIVFAFLILLFLLFSFYPTIFELQRRDNLADQSREFVLEHNYYWPDYNLYLSKIRQGQEGRLTALERYTSETHKGSLIQEFYVVLGLLGKVFQLDPNYTYLLGRLILSPLLLIVILLLAKIYFKSFIWQVLAFLIIVTSGSFPKIIDNQGTIQIARYMEWWSNIDALQRITFIPHILFGQVISFYLLYKLTTNNQKLTTKKLILLIFLGNLAGLAFPPSLITLDTVLFLMLIFRIIKQPKIPILKDTNSMPPNDRSFLGGDTWRDAFAWAKGERRNLKELGVSLKFGIEAAFAFIILTLPSLLYIFFITKFTPWSALVDFHRTHPMMIPFDQYILGTGPIFFLGLAGAIVSIIRRDRKFQPLIFWALATFSFAAIFSIIGEQSPLRFTQTGLFIPLGILGAYLFYQLYHLSNLSHLSDLGRSQLKAAFIIILSLYLAGSLYMMKTSLDWQTTWLSQKIGANIPPVPYPPQSVYPLKSWMEAIRWLRNNTGTGDVVLAEITAGNYIPAYSGNTVYFGQSNTVDYNRKELEVDKFFRGKMTENEALLFLRNNRIKYIFFSVQEKEKAAHLPLSDYYSFVKSVYSNPLVTIYTTIYN